MPRIALLENGVVIRDIQNENNSAEKELEDYFNIRVEEEIEEELAETVIEETPVQETIIEETIVEEPITEEPSAQPEKKEKQE